MNLMLLPQPQDEKVYGREVYQVLDRLANSLCLGNSLEKWKEDIVHEAFVKFRQSPQWGKPIHVGYLRQCVRTALYDLSEKECRLPTDPLDKIVERWEQDPTVSQVEQVREGLQQLPERERRLLRGRYIEGQDHAEIYHDLLGTPFAMSSPNAVKTAVSRALDRLRQIYYRGGKQ